MATTFEHDDVECVQNHNLNTYKIRKKNEKHKLKNNEMILFVVFFYLRKIVLIFLFIYIDVDSQTLNVTL